MSLDITKILDGWEFRPDEVTVRRIIGDDGRPKIQVRLDLGLLQMEWTGRPDGKRPYGKESLLEHFKGLLEEYKTHHGSDEGFFLTSEDTAKLRAEAVQYYHRYVSFLALEEFEGVVRDTSRNLAALDLLWAYGPEDERWQSEQYRPYILTMQARGLVSLSLQRKQYDQALSQLQATIEALEAFYQKHSRPELATQSNEIAFLKEWQERIRSGRPLSLRDRMQKELEEAVLREDYERAAQLRDQIKLLDE